MCVSTSPHHSQHILEDGALIAIYSEKYAYNEKDKSPTQLKRTQTVY